MPEIIRPNEENNEPLPTEQPPKLYIPESYESGKRVSTQNPAERKREDNALREEMKIKDAEKREEEERLKAEEKKSRGRAVFHPRGKSVEGVIINPSASQREETSPKKAEQNNSLESFSFTTEDLNTPKMESFIAETARIKEAAEKAENIPDEERAKLLVELRENWKEANRHHKQQKANEPYDDIAIIRREQLSNRIVKIAEKLTKEDVIGDALALSGCDPSGPKNEEQREAFRRQLTKNVEAIFREQVKKLPAEYKKKGEAPLKIIKIKEPLAPKVENLSTQNSAEAKQEGALAESEIREKSPEENKSFDDLMEEFENLTKEFASTRDFSSESIERFKDQKDALMQKLKTAKEREDRERQIKLQQEIIAERTRLAEDIKRIEQEEQKNVERTNAKLQEDLGKIERRKNEEIASLEKQRRERKWWEFWK